jgi:uncharacterized protein with PIN domain
MSDLIELRRLSDNAKTHDECCFYKRVADEIERLTASNEANADHARLANHNQDLLRASNKRLQARVEELEGVRDAAEQLMWCDACEAKWGEQYETLAEALAATEQESDDE